MQKICKYMHLPREFTSIAYICQNMQKICKICKHEIYMHNMHSPLCWCQAVFFWHCSKTAIPSAGHWLWQGPATSCQSLKDTAKIWNAGCQHCQEGLFQLCCCNAVCHEVSICLLKQIKLSPEDFQNRSLVLTTTSDRSWVSDNVDVNDWYKQSSTQKWMRKFDFTNQVNFLLQFLVVEFWSRLYQSTDFTKTHICCNHLNQKLQPEYSILQMSL